MARFSNLSQLSLVDLSPTDEILINDISVEGNDSSAFKKLSAIDFATYAVTLMAAADDPVIQTDSANLNFNIGDNSPTLKDSNGQVTFFIPTDSSGIINNIIVQGQVTDLANHTTTDLAEGNNLYYTTARSDSAFDVRFTTKSTTNLVEGNNLYYTDNRVQEYIGSGIHFQTYESKPIPDVGTWLYMDSIGDGATSLYFSHANGQKDELISKNRAILYSLIF